MLSQTLLPSAELQNKTLRFRDKRLELAYRQYSFKNLRQQSRMALLIGALMYSLYGFLDILLVPSEIISLVWYIWLSVLIVAFLVYGLTFHKRFLRANQFWLALVGVLYGLSLLFKMWFLPPDIISYYYAGLILLTFWCHNFSGLRFVYATCISLLLLFGFNLTVLWIMPTSSAELISYDFFLMFANLFGAFASYMTEVQSRVLFQRERDLNTERRLMQDRALHDRLTGLPNRELLMDRINQAIYYSTRNNLKCAGLFLDLDHFKPINDTHGHVIGDLVLQQAALRLKQALRDSDTLARLGGDEFFVLARDIRTQQDTEILAQKLKQQLCAPLAIQGLPPFDGLGVSIGICMFPYRNATALDVIRRADEAMYCSKHASGHEAVFAAIN